MPAPPSDSVLDTIIQASITVTASGNSGSGITLPFAPNAYIFIVDLTNLDLAAGDLLDLKIQTAVAGKFFDVAALPQQIGTVSAHASLMKITKAVDENLRILDISTLAANSTINYFGTLWRARWIIAGATPSFTFSVRAVHI